jgi:hypothetical protein
VFIGSELPSFGPETSINNNQQALRNMPGKQRPHLHGSGCLKSRTKENSIIQNLIEIYSEFPRNVPLARSLVSVRLRLHTKFLIPGNGIGKGLYKLA